MHLIVGSKKKSKNCYYLFITFHDLIATIASELAKALTMDFEVELYYCFEKKGVLMDISNENSVIKKLISIKTVKVQCCLKRQNFSNACFSS